jgi:hypothetical protein
MAKAVVVNTVAIGFARDPGELPFDAHAQRLAAATLQLTRIAGHPIAFQFDPALIPEFRFSFEPALIEAVEQVARALKELQNERSDIFAYAGPALRRIEWRYVAAPSDQGSAFSSDSGTLHIELSSQAGGFISSEFVVRTMVLAWLRSLDTRFAEAAPERLPPSEFADYVSWLTYPWGFRQFRGKDAPDYPANSPAALKIERATLLFPRLKRSRVPGSQYAELAAWLTEQVEYFADVYRNFEEGVARAPAESSFRRAEAAWVAWLNANLDKLDDHARFELVRKLFVERKRPVVAASTWGGAVRATTATKTAAFVEDAFPGFDLLGYALRIADQWAAAGHPIAPDPERPGRQSLFDALVCPAPKDPSGSRPFTCERILYRYVADNEARKRLLVAYLLARNDPALTEAAIASATALDDGEVFLMSLWRGLEANAAQCRVATSVVADEVRRIREKTPLHDQAQRLWRVSPAARGETLYLLAGLHEERETVEWDEFARTFAGQATATDFAAFLDVNDFAVERVFYVWGALSRGWSRAGVLAPRLDVYFDALRARKSSASPGVRLVDSLAEQFEAEGACAELAQLRAFVNRRVRSHSSEAEDFEANLYHLPSGGCRPAPAAGKPGSKPAGDVLFGN